MHSVFVTMKVIVNITPTSVAQKTKQRTKLILLLDKVYKARASRQLVVVDLVRFTAKSNESQHPVWLHARESRISVLHEIRTHYHIFSIFPRVFIPGGFHVPSSYRYFETNKLPVLQRIKFHKIDVRLTFDKFLARPRSFCTFDSFVTEKAVKRDAVSSRVRERLHSDVIIITFPPEVFFFKFGLVFLNLSSIISS